jgi:hypothetical protein
MLRRSNAEIFREGGRNENPMSPNSTELLDFAQRYTAAWCGQDPAQVASFFSPNGSLTVNAAAPATGRAAITAIAQSFMVTFPDLHLAMNDLILQSDRAEYHWTLTGTNTGPGGTGQCVRISGFEIWKIGDDGLIEESQGHFDEGSYQQQLKHGVSGSNS